MRPLKRMHVTNAGYHATYARAHAELKHFDRKVSYIARAPIVIGHLVRFTIYAVVNNTETCFDIIIRN